MLVSWKIKVFSFRLEERWSMRAKQIGLCDYNFKCSQVRLVKLFNEMFPNDCYLKFISMMMEPKIQLFKLLLVCSLHTQTSHYVLGIECDHNEHARHYNHVLDNYLVFMWQRTCLFLCAWQKVADIVFTFICANQLSMKKELNVYNVDTLVIRPSIQ